MPFSSHQFVPLVKVCYVLNYLCSATIKSEDTYKILTTHLHKLPLQWQLPPLPRHVSFYSVSCPLSVVFLAISGTLRVLMENWAVLRWQDDITKIANKIKYYFGWMWLSQKWQTHFLARKYTVVLNQKHSVYTWGINWVM